MEWWQAVVLGVVEGVTEYLPVSSTGHLILASSLMGLDETPAQKDAVDAFNIVIQGGAILAVIGLYRARVAQMIAGLLGRNTAGLRLFLLLVVAFLPAPIVILAPKLAGGETLDDTIDAALFHPAPVLAALALGGVYMIVLDRWKVRPGRLEEQERAADEQAGDAESEPDLSQMSFRAALLIGLTQLVAMWPGTSRSMMTITGGVLVGLRPRQAAEFSFLLGLPTLGAACAWSLLKDLTGDGPNLFETLGVAPVLIGVAVATVSAGLAVRWLVGFLNRRGLSPFGWYRLALAALLGGAIVAGFVSIGA